MGENLSEESFTRTPAKSLPEWHADDIFRLWRLASVSDNYAAPQQALTKNQLSIWQSNGNYKNDMENAEPDKELFKLASNSDFVARINKESQLSAGSEWLIFGGALATKGVGKAFVIRQIGHDAGPLGKFIKPFGIVSGIVGAGFLAYELANYLENSERSKHFENRLLGETGKQSGVSLSNEVSSDSGRAWHAPTETTGSRRASESHAQITPDLGSHTKITPDSATKNVTMKVPGVRNLVDAGFDPVNKAIYHYLLSSEAPDHKHELIGRALAHKDLDNREFISWVKAETARSAKYQLIQDSIFGTSSAAGGLYTGYKLGFGRGSILVSAITAAAGLALSRLKTTAEENTDRADLYQARLLSR